MFDLKSYGFVLFSLAGLRTAVGMWPQKGKILLTPSCLPVSPPRSIFAFFL